MTDRHLTDCSTCNLPGSDGDEGRTRAPRHPPIRTVMVAHVSPTSYVIGRIAVSLPCEPWETPDA